MKRIVLENLRSAYNVGNIVRTADALGRGVIWVGYTARADHKQVRKTSLGAEDSIPKMEFDTISGFLDYTKKENIGLLVAELTDTSISILDLHRQTYSPSEEDARSNAGELFLVVGNEVTGVEKETIAIADSVIHIPMLGIKESLNVGQAAAIMMWELSH